MKRVVFITISVVVLILAAIGLSLYGYQLRQDHARTAVSDQQKLEAQQAHRIAYQRAVFEQLPLQAQAVYIKNLTTNEVVYEEASTTSLPLASLVKIMTAVTALKYLDTTTLVTFSPEALAQIGDQGFRLGERIKLDTLIPFMMVTSSNDVAYAIAETVEQATGVPFTDSMYSEAQRLGLTSLSFYNATGLDITTANNTTQPSATGTARDIADLLVFATQQYPEYINPSNKADWNIGSHLGTNTNILTNQVPGFLVSKTGFTNKARGNLAFIVEIGPHQPYVVVIMGSTFDGRFTDAHKIIDALYTVVGTAQNSL